jgi:hypothetical protein
VAKRNQANREEAAMTENTLSPLNNVITIDDGRIKSHLDSVAPRTSIASRTPAALWAGRDKKAEILSLDVYCIVAGR